MCHDTLYRLRPLTVFDILAAASKEEFLDVSNVAE